MMGPMSPRIRAPSVIWTRCTELFQVEPRCPATQKGQGPCPAPAASLPQNRGQLMTTVTSQLGSTTYWFASPDSTESW